MAEMSRTSVVSLDVYPREGSGKGYSNKLFAKGYMPAVLYGKGTESRSVELNARDLEGVLKSKAGRNSIIELHLKAGDKEDSYKVMVKGLQFHPISRSFMHADFMEISLTDKVQVTSRIVLIGDAPGVEEENGILDQVIREVVIKCLPEKIPDIINVDVSRLSIGDSVTVMDLQVEPDVEVLAEDDLVIARVLAAQNLEEEPDQPTVEGEGEKPEE